MSAGLWFSGDTAIGWACRELLAGRQISHADEIAEAGGWRLAAIVHKLRKDYGWPILTVFKGAERIAWYQLPHSHGPLEMPASAKTKGALSGQGKRSAHDSTGGEK